MLISYILTLCFLSLPFVLTSWPLLLCHASACLTSLLLFTFLIFPYPFLTLSIFFSLSFLHFFPHGVFPSPSLFTCCPLLSLWLLLLLTFSPCHHFTLFLHHCFLLTVPLSDVRLRVRAEYLEHESALRDGVSSDKRQPLERQFELFSQANLLLRARDLGSIVCDIKFTELDNLEAFWGDYLSGALLEALKGVFITDSLRMAAGTEGVRLLISVDQDDYEEGRRLLRARKMLSSRNGGHTETHRGFIGW